MVMFVFIVIFFLVMILFYKFTLNSIENDKKEYEFEKFNLLIDTIPNMPEFKCTELGKEKDCIDILKLLAYRSELKNEDYYKELFKDKNIYVQEIYPENNNVECGMNYLNCGKFVIAHDFTGEGILVSGPVSLFYDIDDSYKVGKIVIEGKI